MTDTIEQNNAAVTDDRGDDFTPDTVDIDSFIFTAEDLDALIQKQETADEKSHGHESDKGHDMPSSVPIGRFKEVNDKYKTTAEENARLQAELEAARRLPAMEDLKSKEQQYIELINDGEWEKAADVRLEINAALMQSATIQAERNSESKAQLKEAESASERIWNENPWLHGNDEAQEDFRTWRVIGENKGYSKAKALEYAADKTRPIYASDSDSNKLNGTAKDTRREEALMRGMKDSKRQPPPLSGVGARASDTKARNYTDEELSGLSKDEKARLRGDYV